MKDIEQAFSDYLETHEADELFNTYFHFIRRAFLAGYQAAGGQPPVPQPVAELLPDVHRRHS